MRRAIVTLPTRPLSYAGNEVIDSWRVCSWVFSDWNGIPGELSHVLAKKGAFDGQCCLYREADHIFQYFLFC